ncbi:iron chaperone [Terrisporobacter petrolearius]|uniref:iron chaperone n=1 Tax=Terrisporobacter petrolearius TaxID=1460447 RepID=UPI0031CCAFBD
MKEKNNISIDEYILNFDIKIQKKLQDLRKIIKEEVSEVEETIKYNMPTFMLHGNLVYFAVFKNHIGFYSISDTPNIYIEEFEPFKVGKGSVQFPVDKPLPYELIRKIVRYRVEENTERDKKDEAKDLKEQCLHCGKYLPKNELNKFYEGLICKTCYNLPKN